MPAVATSCREAIGAGIEAAVPDLAGRVHLQGRPEDTAVEYPCVILAVNDVAEQEGDATSSRNQVSYRTRVLICDRVDRFDHGYVGQIESWREAITARFRRKPLPDVAESVHCLIEPLSVYDAGRMGYQHVVSSFVVRAVCYVAQG